MSHAIFKRVVFAGGGTGGHVFPALALAEACRARVPKTSICFVGTRGGMEEQILPKHKERLYTLATQGIKGRSITKRLLGMQSVLASVGEAKAILRKEDATLVIGVGGYASVSALLAAKALGIPTFLCEQNKWMGLSNRLMCPLVKKVFLSFEDTDMPKFARSKSVVTGNPIRAAFMEKRKELQHQNDRGGGKHILVLGGSQGSRALNEWVPESLALLPKASLLPIIHQSGSAMQSNVQARYDGFAIEAKAVGFMDGIMDVMADAALVIGRAGATSLAELTALGLPAILVPLPTAADDHQTKNAMHLQEAGAAIVVNETSLKNDPHVLAEAVLKGLSDVGMRRASFALGRPRAAEEILNAISQTVT